MQHGVSRVQILVVFDIVQDTEPLRPPNHKCQFQMLDSKWYSYVRQAIAQTDNCFNGGGPPADSHSPECGGAICLEMVILHQVELERKLNIFGQRKQGPSWPLHSHNADDTTHHVD